MKTNTIKRNTFFAFIAICIAISIAVVFNAAGFRTMSAYAMESEETIGCEGVEEIDREINESFIEQEAFEELEDIMVPSGGSGRSSNEGIISGTTASTLLFSDLTNVKYIPNANYFLINPQQGINDGSDNKGGTCTTVAMQMLMGYHNYYSDRRIIPEMAANGTRFLDANYGDLALHPAFQRTHVADTWIGGVLTRGCPSIGTANTVYQDIFDRTWISSWYGIGQAVGLVKDGAVRFINTHTPQAARNGMSLTSGLFSASTARSDIDAGRPIVLGYQPIFTDADSFHVVPAYGYAKLDGVDGFLVHYGWGASRTQVWVPASWFGFQIRMSTTHTHSFVEGGNRNDTHRDLTCSICGATSVDPLYNLSGGTISGIRHTLSGSVTIPKSINIYNTAAASFVSQNITAIGNSTFANYTLLTSITVSTDNQYLSSQNGILYNKNKTQLICYPAGKTDTSFAIPSTVITIGAEAFAACYNLKSVTIPNGVTSISNGAFRYCYSLTSVTLPSSVTSIGNQAFYECTGLQTLVIPSSVTSIGYEAFYYCCNLTTVTMQRTTPPTLGADAFFCCENLTIRVPSAAYGTAQNWSAYSGIMIVV